MQNFKHFDICPSSCRPIPTLTPIATALHHDLVEMLKIVAAEIQFTQSGERPPSSEEEEIVLTQSSVLEVDVDETLTHAAQHHTETITHVTVAQIQASQLGQRLHKRYVSWHLFHWTVVLKLKVGNSLVNS